MSGYGVLAVLALMQEGSAPTLLDDPPPELYRPVESPSVPLLTSESPFPRVISVVDLDDWRTAEDLRSLREWAGDVFFGLPLILPQLLLEEFIPRGLAVGPTTFLYKTSSDSRTLPLIVFDQILFHEAEFLAQAQSLGDSGAAGDPLLRGQRHVLRGSLRSGFRATYALPTMSMDQIAQTAAEEGLWGYLLAPAAGGAILFLKGVDQKFSVDDVVKARIQLTSGRQWARSVRSPDGLPAINCELKFANFPVALIVSFEMSDHGMVPQFIGLGTSLDVVEELLSRDENRALRPNQ
jgi:hypothetical protein